MRIEFTMNDTALSEIERSRAADVFSPMDEDAFRQFYDRTSRAVWVYLSRMVSDRQLADDLLQETYYRFYRAAKTYESETHRRNALYCIATNIARDTLRQRMRAEVVELPEEDILSGDDRTASQAEGRTDLARAMQQLKPIQREMLWLAYAQGASHDEIAEIVGVKSKSIRLLLLRARRKLASILRSHP
jgi:RNA polymerase sigma-70 factor (ECF subfamily)